MGHRLYLPYWKIFWAFEDLMRILRFNGTINLRKPCIFRKTANCVSQSLTLSVSLPLPLCHYGSHYSSAILYFTGKSRQRNLHVIAQYAKNVIKVGAGTWRCRQLFRKSNTWVRSKVSLSGCGRGRESGLSLKV